MATTTARRRTKAPDSLPTYEAPPQVAPARDVEGAAEPLAAGRIALALITPHPENPRKTFDPEKLKSLAESMKRHDVLQPVLVRPQGEPGHYQLVAGERRYRAAKLAGLADIPATVRMLDDGEALELMIVENEDREDLNPIEMALGLAALCKPVDAGGRGYTQKQVADRFGHAEAWANNLIRLLALPESWRKRVASGELPQTYARAAIPYAKSAAVMKFVEDLYFGDNAEEILSAHDRDDFEDSLDAAVHDVTRPMDEKKDKPFWDHQVAGGSFGRLFKLTPDVEAQLSVCELPVNLAPRWQKSKREVLPRATNVELWDRLQEDAKRAKIEKRQARAAKGKGGAKGAKGDKKKAPTAAELKRKREEQDQQLARRVEEWAEDLVRVAVARELESGDAAARWLCRYYGHGNRGYRPTDTMDDAFAKLGAACEGGDWDKCVAWLHRDEDEITALDDLDLAEARVILDPDGERRCYLDSEVIWGMAEWTKVKLADEWKAASGARLRRFFELHTTDQLFDLWREVGDFAPGTERKKDLVEKLAESHEGKPLKVPQVLAAVAPKPKRGRKPR